MSEPIPLLTFSLAEQTYALFIDQVVEVAAMVEMTRLPGGKPALLGVVNRHGAPLPLLDLHLIMEQGRAVIDDTTTFVVVRCRGELFGLVVGEVHQVQYFQAEQIRKPGGSGYHIHGIISEKGKIIQIIDAGAILSPYLSLKVDT